MRNTLAVAALIVTCSVASAAPNIVLAEGAWQCPEWGWLTNASDGEKRVDGHCRQSLLSATPVVVLEVEYPLAFTCSELRGPMQFHIEGRVQPKNRIVTCGYVLQPDLRDAEGKQLTAMEVQTAANKSSYLDVHKLPYRK
jgi:hypothetical protein